MLRTIDLQVWEGGKPLQKVQDVYKEEGIGSREGGLAGADTLSRMKALQRRPGTLELPVNLI